MKVAIIQFSDIHFSNSNNIVAKRASLIGRASRNIINECDKAIIVISGDVANKGRKEEYEAFSDFLSNTTKDIISENPQIDTVDYIIVPGNHDCNFQDDSIRDLVIGNVIKCDELTDKKQQEKLLDVQNNFWDFYKNTTGIDVESKIAHEIVINLTDGKTMSFGCYNTALTSKLKETVGEIIVPKNYYLSPNSTYNIAVFHHNTGWLSPSTESNNKKSFEHHLLSNFQFVFCGHEHEESIKFESSLTEDNKVVYIEGDALQYNNVSGFRILVLDTDKDTYVIHRFSIVTSQGNAFPSYYKDEPTQEQHLSRTNLGYSFNDAFNTRLNKLNVPFVHPSGKELHLDDIFVYPDLETAGEDYEDRGNIFDSQTLVANEKEGVILISGDTQSGKSSLLYFLAKDFFQKGKYPILLKGRDIKHPNIKDLLAKSYKEQYSIKRYSFDNYCQLDKDRKVILIDNLNDSSLNDDGKKELLCNLLKNHSQVIATIDDEIDTKLGVTSEEDKQSYYRILPFGYVKRNKLVNKWINLDLDVTTTEASDKERILRETFDQLDNLLGEQFLPAYPFFLLTLLQSMNKAANSFDTQPTYYAFCYNTILIGSLKSVGLELDEMKEVLQFLKELAFFMYTRDNVPNKRRCSDSELRYFYNSYIEKHVFSFNYEQILDILKNANLFIKNEFEEYKFTYKYLYFYLVAQIIAKNINSTKGKEIIENLCENSYEEESANILLFTVYHSEDVSLIKKLILNSMKPFSSYSPITLATDDHVFMNLNNIIGKISSNKLIADSNPEDVREKDMEKMDRLSRISKKERLNKEDIKEIQNHPILHDLNRSYRSIRILGQIVKNQKASIDRSLINELLNESYKVCFRTVSFYAKLIEDSTEFISQMVEESKEVMQTKEEIRALVTKSFMPLLYQFCLKSFANLAFSVGTKNSGSIYDKVSENINTPAAKLITFTIKSYYGPMNIAELKELALEFKNNPMALHILRARVIKYVYTNTIEFKKKSKIAEICNLKLEFLNPRRIN